MALRSRRRQAIADLADDAALGLVLDRGGEARGIDPHRRLALHEEALRLVPVEAGDAGGPIGRQQLLVVFRRGDGVRRIGRQLQRPGAGDGFLAPAGEKLRPQHDVGVAHTAADEARDAGRRIVQGRRRRHHLVHGLGERDALLREQLLVVVDHEVVAEDRQGVDLAVGRGGEAHAELGYVAELVLGRHHLRVLQPVGDLEQPAALLELALLDMKGEVEQVERRLARIQLDRHFLPRLLLGDHLDAELDAGLVEELLLVLLHEIGARAGLHQHLDLLALEALPVEGAALGIGGDGVEHRCRNAQGGGALQRFATRHASTRERTTHLVPPDSLSLRGCSPLETKPSGTTPPRHDPLRCGSAFRIRSWTAVAPPLPAACARPRRRASK